MPVNVVISSVPAEGGHGVLVDMVSGLPLNSSTLTVDGHGVPVDMIICSDPFVSGQGVLSVTVSCSGLLAVGCSIPSVEGHRVLVDRVSSSVP